MKNVLHHFYERQMVLKCRWENPSPAVRPIVAVYHAEGIQSLLPWICAYAQENSLLFQFYFEKGFAIIKTNSKGGYIMGGVTISWIGALIGLAISIILILKN